MSPALTTSKYIERPVPAQGQLIGQHMNAASHVTIYSAGERHDRDAWAVYLASQPSNLIVALSLLSCTYFTKG